MPKKDETPESQPPAEPPVSIPVLYRDEKFLSLKMPDNPKKGGKFMINGKEFRFTDRAVPRENEIPLGDGMMKDIHQKLAKAGLMGVVTRSGIVIDKSKYLTEEELTAREAKELAVIESRLLRGELSRNEADREKAEKKRAHGEFRAKKKV